MRSGYTLDMSDRSPQANPGEPDAMPPIPDGGLGSGMPEWLRRPPAWRSAGTTPVPPKRNPPPDSSPIDPRTILTLDDLPAWLQGIATATSEARSAQRENPPVDRDDDAPTIVAESALDPPSGEPERAIVAPSLLPSVTAAPAVSVRRGGDGAPPWFRVSSGRSPKTSQRWTAITATLALSAALLVALLVILLLTAGNL